MGKDFKTNIEYVKDRPGHDRKYALDWSKIKKALGWQPEHDFDSHLKETIQWYKDNQTWWKPLKQESKDYLKEQYGSHN